MDNIQDKKNLHLLASGSTEAFDALYLKYHPKLKAFLTSFIKDEELAGDFAQDIFMKIWINRGSLSEISNFSAYIFSSARYAIFNYYRRNIHKAKYIANTQMMPAYADFLEDDILSSELDNLIRTAVENMPTKRKKIYLLSREGGLSNQEIADMLNISKRTIENQITLALAMLRRVIMSAKIIVIILIGICV